MIIINENEDFNYFIETTQNIPFRIKNQDNFHLNYSVDKENKSPQNYISKLEKKNNNSK